MGVTNATDSVPSARRARMTPCRLLQSLARGQKSSQEGHARSAIATDPHQPARTHRHGTQTGTAASSQCSAGLCQQSTCSRVLSYALRHALHAAPRTLPSWAEPESAPVPAALPAHHAWCTASPTWWSSGCQAMSSPRRCMSACAASSAVSLRAAARNPGYSRRASCSAALSLHGCPGFAYTSLDRTQDQMRHVCSQCER